MSLPVIRGLIDRRILVNFRVAPEVVAKLLPAPFRPKLIEDRAIAGVCLIRLKQIRPWFLPAALGIGSENAAHRFAVEWDDQGKTHEGVFIPRRDTSSRLNTLAGGRIFPGEHHLARFNVRETHEQFRVALDSYDGATHFVVEGQTARCLPSESVFGSLESAVQFFRAGALGYSPAGRCGYFDGLELRCDMAGLTPFDVTNIESSYFEDRGLFPAGSACLDSALLMQRVEHEWHQRAQLMPGERGAVSNRQFAVTNVGG